MISASWGGFHGSAGGAEALQMPAALALAIQDAEISQIL